jgi:hypothetical protein
MLERDHQLTWLAMLELLKLHKGIEPFVLVLLILSLEHMAAIKLVAEAHSIRVSIFARRMN